MKIYYLFLPGVMIFWVITQKPNACTVLIEPKNSINQSTFWMAWDESESSLSPLYVNAIEVRRQL